MPPICARSLRAAAPSRWSWRTTRRYRAISRRRSWRRTRRSAPNSSPQRGNMPYIRTIPDAAAEGVLRGEYEAALRRAGKIFNVLRIQSLRPKVLRASLALYTALMLEAGALPRWQRELLAVVVSRTNGCRY